MYLSKIRYPRTDPCVPSVIKFGENKPLREEDTELGSRSKVGGKKKLKYDMNQISSISTRKK